MSPLSPTIDPVAGWPRPSTPTRPGAVDQLFTAGSLGHYREVVGQGADAVARAVARVDGPGTGARPADLRAAVADIDLDAPLPDTAAALTELDSIYLRDAVYFHHPRYAAHLNCPVVIPALVAETVLTAVNSSLDTWDQSAGATMIERRLIDWTAQRLCLGPSADGVFTSGGSQSNLQALLMARDEAVASLRAAQGQARLPELLPRLRIFASAAAHFSVSKSASLLGLGEDAVVAVDTDDRRRMDPASLAAALSNCTHHGNVPMAVVATAGTTDFGSIDPLAEIATISRRFGAWLHVDAAYGGGLMTSMRHRHRLAGVESADSVTVDFHKTFFQPVSCSAVLVRDAAMLGHVTHHADYLNPRSAANARIPNQVDKSLQTTRRFDALKFWLTLRLLGADGIGELLDAAIDLAERTGEAMAADPEFELAAEVQLSTVVFRHRPAGVTDEASLDAVNLHIRRALADSGRAMVAATRVDGRHFLKLTLLNADAGMDDIRAIMGLIRAAAGSHEMREAS